MNSNKRSYDDMNDNKKSKKDIEIDTFNGKIDLNNFEEYIEKIRNFQNEVNELVSKRKIEKMLDSDVECASMTTNLKKVKHNINYNIFHLEKICRILKNLEGDFKTNIEDFCDHDIYSECEYHNDRYYYCKKCTYER